MSENAAIHRDVFWLMADRLISNGISRNVYTSSVFPDCVVKVEEDACMFQNVMEWQTWGKVRGTALEKWFAPCKWISPNGSVLIMKKTTEPAEKHYLKQLPVFLTDTKRSNYGMYQGRLVCHDYGTSLLMEYGMSKRMRNVEWWG